MSAPTVGIDIGTTAVRVVAVSGVNAETAAKITRAAIVPLEPGACTGGRIADPAAVGWAISRAIRNARVRAYGAVLGVCGSDTAMARVSLPSSLKASEWAQVLRLNKMEISPKVPLETSTVALCPLEDPGDAKNRSLLAAGATDADVARVLAAAKKAKVTPRALDLSAAATVRAFTRAAVGNDDVATLVDIGASKVTVATRQGLHLRSMRTFDNGGERLTRAVMGAISDTYENAEELKLSMRLSGDAHPADPVPTPTAAAAYGSVLAPPPVQLPTDPAQAALDAAGTTLVEEIAAAIDADTVAHPSRPTQGILLCGGGSLMRGLRERLVQRVGVPAVIGRPWAVMVPSKRLDTSLGEGVEDPVVLMSLATAVGLAMWRKP